jgi:hypothetical protein
MSYNELMNMHWMAVLMAVVGWLCASARKYPDTDTILTVKCLLPLVIDLEGLEHLSLLLSTGE